jgi:hypothetical protein
MAEDHSPEAEKLNADVVSAGARRAPKVVFPLHGIRTQAEWQRKFTEVAHYANWWCQLDTWNFGKFSLFQFLWPPGRKRKIKWFEKTYYGEINDRRLELDKNQLPSVVAHSFGTYILGYAMRKREYLRFNKIILCGSILPRSFEWDLLLKRGQVRAVRNEYGVKDPWVKLVRFFVAGTGDSGAVGFARKHARLEEQEFDYNHSDFFEEGHMQEYWIPFLEKAAPVLPSRDIPIPPTRESRPVALYLIVLAACIVLTAMGINFSQQATMPLLSGGDRVTASDTGHITRLESQNLSESVSWTFDSVVIPAGTVIQTNGHDLSIHVKRNLIVDGEALIRAFDYNGRKDSASGVDGRSGADGLNHTGHAAGTGARGRDGGNGASAEPGGDGNSGASAGTITLIVEGTATGQLVVVNRGLNGTTGGNGGRGGKGGHGEDGGPGANAGDIRYFGTGRHMGDGGNGGAGGKGGDGGRGGDGGSGGPVTVQVAHNEGFVLKQIDVSGGQAGSNGEPGDGGLGGPPGGGHSSGGAGRPGPQGSRPSEVPKDGVSGTVKLEGVQPPP